MTGAVRFQAVPPLSGEVLADHVRLALVRCLPSATPRPKALKIIANGPSALLADLTGETLAVNGAINLFGEVGPTYWVAFDPQEGVAALLPADPPKNTIYLVAAQCHPAVFTRLEGRDVRLWNVEHPATADRTPDGVPTAVSVTLMAMQLMARLGYRRFDTWGWDGCYMTGQDHAAPQAHASAENIRVRVGTESFETTTAWAAEAQDACALLALADFKVTIHGGGMIGAIVKARVRR